jgi:multicomponent Na+:H+ antiporter subunit G
MQLLGDIVIMLGILFMAFGIIGIYRFKNFYTRLLFASKIDTVGAMTILMGLIIKHGVSYFSAKLVLLIILMLILNPLVAHTTSRSAYLSGYNVDEATPESKI